MDMTAEWLEADGLGGFASGTVSGIRTRRYHALLLTASTPPTGRYVLVNGLEAWVETAEGSFCLSSQAYEPDVIHPDGAQRIESFTPDPWPHWRFRLADGTQLEHDLFVRSGTPLIVLGWRQCSPHRQAKLFVRPLLSGRDYHALHHENAAFRFEADVNTGPLGQVGQVRWQPYPDVPQIRAISNGTYIHRPDWYRNFLYSAEQARGLDCSEDLASPGIFSWNLSQDEAIFILTVDDQAEVGSPSAVAVADYAYALRTAEAKRRQRFPSPLDRAADAYLVQRGAGKTIVAGYPWFTDWGRDTFIALRGLCLATGRLEDAREILLAWAETVSEGMLPNRFPDYGDTPEFNAVDASLWYIIAVHDFLQTTAATQHAVSQHDRARLEAAVEAILSGYTHGTRYGIRVDDDGLLLAGEPGVQLTWMDAKVGDWVVTPRIGKPVEVEALWLNALAIGRTFSARWDELFTHGCSSFQTRFWNEAGGYVYDVVDPDHHVGTADATFRPNQIFAVGGLPQCLLPAARARQLVNAVEARLWTPLGLRSLAPTEPGYCPRYAGGVHKRDGAYHQGTVWPWLIGPFVEAWLRVHGGTPEAKHEARARYLEPLLQHLGEAGLGHISEIADGDAPHTPAGCPFQAWSVGELLRLMACILRQGDEH